MKKVCMLVNNDFTHDNRVKREASTLIKNNFQVVIIALKIPGRKTQSTIEDKILVKRIISNPFGIVSYKLNHFISFFSVIMALKKEDADIYHAHDLDALIPTSLVAKSKNTKLIYDAHELWYDRNYSGNIFKRIIRLTKLEKYIWRMLEKKFVKKVDVTITVNESLAEIMKKKYHIKKPLIIMNCPEYKYIKSNNILYNVLNIEKNKKIVLYIGALIENRGLVNFINASRHLVNNTIAVIIGDGPLKIKLHNLIIKYRLQDKVKILPAVPPDRVLKYISSAAIGVAPIEPSCLSYYYCLPNKVFEYLISTIPIVASNLPELSRIIHSNNIGLTFNPYNPRDFAQKINQLLKNGEYYNKLRENVKQTAKKYNWQIESKKLISIYNDIIEK